MAARSATLGPRFYDGLAEAVGCGSIGFNNLKVNFDFYEH